jgi:hypothetical protein
MALVLCLSLAGCGYVGDPMPPALHIPEPVRDLRVEQRGDRLLFAFSLPELTTEGLGISRLQEIELRAGPWPGEWQEASFQAHASSIPVPADAARGVIQAEAALPPSWAGQPVFAAVWLVGPTGRRSETSNRVAFTPVPPLDAPASVRAEGTPQGVRVVWDSLPRPEARYEVFREQPGHDAAPVLLAGGVEGPAWLDTSARFEQEYRYSVQAVIPLGEVAARSPRSAVTTITYTDLFPPSPPAALRAVAALDAIALSWERPPEPDTAAFFVYRAPPDGEWMPIAGPISELAYHDRAVEPGAQYRYAVTAADRSGNESARSAVVEIMVPRP